MVFTWFLFVQTRDLTSILSVRLDMQGQIDQPLEMRTVPEIRALQDKARTIVVFPTDWCGLYQIELPILAERKAREAIPFALEDAVAQSVTQMHFAFDKACYQNGRYCVAVIDKQLMSDWMTAFSEIGLNYDQITLDWFALYPGEGCVNPQSILVHAEQFQGALGLDIWEHYPHPWASSVAWQLFPDSAALPESASQPQHSFARQIWLAERLYKNKFLNLCQGDFQHATSQMQIKRKYQSIGVIAAAWFLSFIGIHLGLYMMINQKNKEVDQQIAQSYRVFFPGATQIISPKIRVEQLLKQNQLGNNATLWSLLESFSLALTHAQAQTTPVKSHLKTASLMQSLQFQNQVLTVVFHCENFSALEQIESFLQNKQVHVQQISAATETDQVIAKLELSL